MTYIKQPFVAHVLSVDINVTIMCQIMEMLLQGMKYERVKKQHSRNKKERRKVGGNSKEKESTEIACGKR